MDTKEYIEGTVVKLESKDYDVIRARLDVPGIRLLHAAIGMNTEAGEVIDLVKKKLFYGKSVDRTKFLDEMGDLVWYLGLACDVLGTTFEELKAGNAAKLAERYREGKFSAQAAINPNKSKEMEALQKATS